jgi:hypothetical protein
MNARDNTPLRSKIALYLSGIESATAAEVAQAAGLANTPSRVINELNAMRSDALVECEPRGKKKEIAYWLAVPLEQIADAPVETFDLPAAIKPGTRPAHIWHALRNGARLKASELTTMLKVNPGALDPTLRELYRSRIIGRTKGPDGVYRYHRPRTDADPAPTSSPAAEGDTGGGQTPSSNAQSGNLSAPALGCAEVDYADAGPVWAAPEVTYLAPEDYDMPQPDPGLLASANRMLRERLEGVAHALRDSGLPALANIAGSEDLQPHVVALSEAYQAALSDLQCRTESMHAACAALAKIGERLGIKPNDCGALPITEAIADLQNTLHSTTSAYEALIESTEPRQPGLCASQIEGFVVRTSKRALKEAKSLDQANAAVESAIRSGARRAKAFALVPVSEAVLGVEWKKKA